MNTQQCEKSQASQESDRVREFPIVIPIRRMVDATWSFPQSLRSMPLSTLSRYKFGLSRAFAGLSDQQHGCERADASSLTAMAKEPYNGRYREVIVLHWTTSYSVDCFAAGLVEGDDPPHEEAGILSKGQ
jgi:hypothetical protein